MQNSSKKYTDGAPGNYEKVRKLTVVVDFKRAMGRIVACHAGGREFESSLRDEFLESSHVLEKPFIALFWKEE